MPSSKKAAKKASAKSAPKHEDTKDLRRAYEHRGRVEVLRPLLGKNVAVIDALVELAEQELVGSHLKDAADLFRAAEHLSFGYLAAGKPDEHSHPRLSEGVEKEFQHKLEKAEEQWEDSEALGDIYHRAFDGAQKAFRDGAHQKALELVRAADAIAYVRLHDAEES